MRQGETSNAWYPYIISSSGNAYEPARYAYKALAHIEADEEELGLQDAVEMEMLDILWPDLLKK